jgi:hypothetical protein
MKYQGVDNLTADITDSGQMFNAMSFYAALDELEGGNGIKFLLPTAGKRHPEGRRISSCTIRRLNYWKNI